MAGARLASSARTCPPLGTVRLVVTAIAALTPGALMIVAARPSGTGTGVSARTSAPAPKADWSSADWRQL